ncbi:MAG: glycosyltransferase family 4 protein [Candidatus Alcyoniella australis]|nr:glycosyltransferase family 4 protein [Candidatus Alcyoniella australis]
MRILGCSIDFRPKDGGISTFAFEVARSLQKEVDEVYFVASRVEGWREFDKTSPFPIYRTDFALAPMNKTIKASLQELRNMFSSMRLFRRVIRENKIECIVCFHWRIFGLVSLLLARWMGIKFCMVGYGLELAPYRRRKVRGLPWSKALRNLTANLVERAENAVRAAAFRKADGVFAISEFTEEMIRSVGVDQQRLCMTYCGVDPQAFTPEAGAGEVLARHGLEGKRVVVSISRLIRRKGMDKALHAFGRVLERVPDAIYLIVGRGPYEKDLRKIVAERKLEQHVVFAGFVPDEELPQYYNASELFLLPCREVPGGDVEGFGIVFLEANACIKPVVAGRSGGVVDAVEDGVSGILVDPLDEQQIADAVVKLLQDRELAATMGRQGRERVLEKFTWQAVGQRFHRCIQNVIEHGRPC